MRVINLEGREYLEWKSLIRNEGRGIGEREA